MEMRYVRIFVVWGVIFALTHSETSIYKTGWLDRVVEYYKQRFIADVQDKLPPIEFKASIVKAPTGYEDSKKWDYESVVRLLKLIRSSEKNKPVAKALRRVLHPKTRRMSKQKSYVKFPKSKVGDVYYEDSYYNEYGIVEDEGFDTVPGDVGDIEEESVVIISNPVEARLPSAHISVRMLREILEARAEAARVMPPTRPSSMKWVPMSTSSTKASKADATSPSPKEVTTQKTAVEETASKEAALVTTNSADTALVTTIAADTALATTIAADTALVTTIAADAALVTTTITANSL